MKFKTWSKLVLLTAVGSTLGSLLVSQINQTSIVNRTGGINSHLSSTFTNDVTYTISKSNMSSFLENATEATSGWSENNTFTFRYGTDKGGWWLNTADINKSTGPMLTNPVFKTSINYNGINGNFMGIDFSNPKSRLAGKITCSVRSFWNIGGTGSEYNTDITDFIIRLGQFDSFGTSQDTTNPSRFSRSDFHAFTNLESLTFDLTKNSVTRYPIYLANNAFKGCSNLKTAKITSSVLTTSELQNKVVIQYYGNVFKDCTSLTSPLLIEGNNHTFSTKITSADSAAQLDQAAGNNYENTGISELNLNDWAVGNSLVALSNFVNNSRLTKVNFFGSKSNFSAIYAKYGNNNLFLGNNNLNTVTLNGYDPLETSSTDYASVAKQTNWFNTRTNLNLYGIYDTHFDVPSEIDNSLNWDQGNKQVEVRYNLSKLHNNSANLVNWLNGANERTLVLASSDSIENGKVAVRGELSSDKTIYTVIFSIIKPIIVTDLNRYLETYTATVKFSDGTRTGPVQSLSTISNIPISTTNTTVETGQTSYAYDASYTNRGSDNGLWLTTDSYNVNNVGVPTVLTNGEAITPDNFNQFITTTTGNQEVLWVKDTTREGRLTSSAGVLDFSLNSERSTSVKKYYNFNFNLNHAYDNAQTVNLKVKNSATSSPTIQYKIWDINKFDPNAYNLTKSAESYTLKPGTNDIVFNVTPAASEQLKNSYQWQATKGRRNVVDVSTATFNPSTHSNILTMGTAQFSRDFSTVTVHVNLASDPNTEDNVNLSGLKVKINNGSSTIKTVNLPDVNLHLVPPDQRIDLANLTYDASRAVINHDGHDGLWINGDQASFDITLSKALINNISDVTTLMNQFNTWFQTTNVTQDIKWEVNNNSLVWKNTLRLTLKMSTTGVPSGKVKISFNVSVLKPNLEKGYVTFYLIAASHYRFADLVAYEPKELDPQLKVVNDGRELRLSATNPNATAVFPLRTYKTDYQSIYANTFAYIDQDGKRPNLKFSPNTFNNEQVQLTNFRFDADYSNILADISLLKDQIGDQALDLNLNSIRILDSSSGDQEIAHLQQIHINIDSASEVVNKSQITYDYSKSERQTRKTDGLWLTNDVASFSFDAPNALFNNENILSLNESFNKYVVTTFDYATLNWKYSSVDKAFISTGALPLKMTITVNDKPGTLNIRSYQVNIMATDEFLQVPNGLLSFRLKNEAASDPSTEINIHPLNGVDPGIVDGTPDQKLYHINETETGRKLNFNYVLDGIDIGEGQIFNTYSYIANNESINNLRIEAIYDHDYFDVITSFADANYQHIAVSVNLKKSVVKDTNTTLKLKTYHNNELLATLADANITIDKGNTYVELMDLTYKTVNPNKMEFLNDLVTFKLRVPDLLLEDENNPDRSLINALVVKNGNKQYTWHKVDDAANTFNSNDNHYQISYKAELKGLAQVTIYEVTFKQIYGYSDGNPISIGIINQDAKSEIAPIETAPNLRFNWEAFGGGIAGSIVFIFLLVWLIKKRNWFHPIVRR